MYGFTLERALDKNLLEIANNGIILAVDFIIPLVNS
jgi:hypothetical protein